MNVYKSGLDADDWICLRNVIWPFIHAEDIKSIPIVDVPDHLKEHRVVKFIRMYKETGNDEYLDKAGQCLIPTTKPFGWYLPLTK